MSEIQVVANSVTPTPPPAGYLALYAKLDGLWYVQDSAGAETSVGPVTSVAGKVGVVTLVKADVGLGLVDNTSDANKPVSTAQQAALNLKLNAVLREAANGVAGLDANSEVIKPQAGAAAQAAAGLGAGYKRADGTWARVATSLPQDFPLQTWADNLVAGVVYDVNLTVAQNGLPIGWWYIEVLRHLNDTSSNQFRVIRATSFGSGNAANLVYQSTNAFGTWTPFYQFAINTPLNWTAPTFVNGWAGVTSPQYTQDYSGTVFMRGTMYAGSNTINTTAFTLPVGMRPLMYHVFSPRASGGSYRLDVNPNGVVAVVASAAHTGNVSAWASIQACFKGEQ